MLRYPTASSRFYSWYDEHRRHFRVVIEAAVPVRASGGRTRCQALDGGDEDSIIRLQRLGQGTFALLSERPGRDLRYIGQA